MTHTQPQKNMATSPRTPAHQSGFSLIELMVVVLIIGIITAIAIVTFTGQSAKAQVAHCSTLLKNAETIMEERIALDGAQAWEDLEFEGVENASDFIRAGGIIASKYCDIIQIDGTGGNGGTITAALNAESQREGETMIFARNDTTDPDALNGITPWQCTGGTIPTELLPDPCQTAIASP